MKSILVGAFLTMAGVVLVGCGSAGSPDGTSSDEALSNGPTTSSAAPANTIMKVTPGHVIMKVDPSGPSTSSSATCPVGEHSCEMANDKGICVERCIPAGEMCVAPNCVVCDPAGPRPNPACTWNSEECEWDCPVCDPSGPAPEPGCKWDSKACVWLCL